MMNCTQIDTAQHTAILGMGVSIRNQWRASEQLTVPNLLNANLSGFSLENANLAKANLRGACLDSAYLYDADFQEADLRGASLNRAVLIGANFCKANLADATLEHAYLAQSDLSHANLTGARLQSADLQSALMTKTILANARLANAEMTESFGLTSLQIQSATDGHLAFLQDALKCWPPSTTVANRKGEVAKASPQKTAQPKVLSFGRRTRVSGQTLAGTPV